MIDSAEPVGTWETLGTNTPEIRLVAVELHQVELVFRRPIRTARGEHRRRPVVLVRVVGAGPNGPLVGWGECAALADRTYDAEDVETAWSQLERSLVPALFVSCGPDHRLPAPSSLAQIRRVAAPHAPLAFAALEMAVTDAHLRASGMSLAKLLDIQPGPVAAGAVIGRFDTDDQLVAQVDSLVDAGFRRVKMKIEPGADIGPVATVRARYPELGMQVDANESYDERDADHLKQLDEFELLCIEQPFRRDLLEAHARLAARITTPICLDESLTSPLAVAAALASGACSVVCIKPARLGGIGTALETARACRSGGVPMWIGGMFESGYARQVNAAIAGLPGFSWPGDLSPARGYLDEDLLDGGGPDPAWVNVPAVPGAGLAPDLPTLLRLTTRQLRLEAMATAGIAQRDF